MTTISQYVRKLVANAVGSPLPFCRLLASAACINDIQVLFSALKALVYSVNTALESSPVLVLLKGTKGPGDLAAISSVFDSV